MKKLLCLCFSLCVGGGLAQLISQGHTPVIDTSLGQIFGDLWNTYGRYEGMSVRLMYAFKGIPYGKAPFGEKRFLPAEPYGSWEGVLNATKYGAECMQTGLTGSEASGSEDCLFLHIYTPEPPNGTALSEMNLPVMFWIHGGAFSSGSAPVYLPGRLLNYDVVLVVIHYRLGPFGYLCLHHDDIPGNAGMFDQVLALEWVRDNIREYGGNPDKVTIFGESAGAASASLHLLSKESEGKFHQVIAQSGSALSEWAVDRKPVESATEIARIAGCESTDTQLLVDCLRTVNASILSEAYLNYSLTDRGQGGLGFGGSTPCVQQAGARKFLDRHPQYLMKTNNFTHVPVMYGANRHEGSFVLGLAYWEFIDANNLEEDEEFLSEHMMKVVLNALAIYDTSSATEQAMLEKHMHNATMGNFTSMSPGIIDVFGVWMLKHGGYLTVEKQSAFADSYFYSFDFQGAWSLFYFTVGFKPVPFKTGVSHAHELPYIFNMPFPLRPNEVQVSHWVTQMWTNFAIYGNPTPSENPVDGVPVWPKFDPETQPYMMINNETTVEHDYTKTYTIAVEDNMIANDTNNNWPVPTRLEPLLKNFQNIHLNPKEAIDIMLAMGGDNLEPEFGDY